MMEKIGEKRGKRRAEEKSAGRESGGDVVFSPSSVCRRDVATVYKTAAAVYKVESNVTREALINCKCAGQTAMLRDRGGEAGRVKGPEDSKNTRLRRRGGQKVKWECDALRNSRATGSRSSVASRKWHNTSGRRCHVFGSRLIARLTDPWIRKDLPLIFSSFFFFFNVGLERPRNGRPNLSRDARVPRSWYVIACLGGARSSRDAVLIRSGDHGGSRTRVGETIASEGRWEERKELRWWTGMGRSVARERTRLVYTGGMLVTGRRDLLTGRREGDPWGNRS